MNTTLTMERQEVIEQVLDATTWDEIESASKLLDCWLLAHPDDLGMEDGYEQLSLLRSGLMAEAKTAEPVGAR